MPDSPSLGLDIGSVNAKLLTERDANLCLKCHMQQVSGSRLRLIDLSPPDPDEVARRARVMDGEWWWPRPDYRYHQGQAEAHRMTSDLSVEYVRFNSAYRT